MPSDVLVSCPYHTLRSYTFRRETLMEKQKRWQFFVIIAVFILTLYNILPTIIYYSKPLKSPITEARAKEVEIEVADRVDSLEGQAREWLVSFCRLLNIKPKEMRFNTQDPSLIEIDFASSAQASFFKQHLALAGLEIPFVPAQLGVIPGSDESKTVFVARRIGVRIDDKDVSTLFHFSKKFNAQGKIEPFYLGLVADRFEAIAVACNGGSAQASEITEIFAEKEDSEEALFAIAHKLIAVVDVFGPSSEITQRYLKTFAQTEGANQDSSIRKLATKFEDAKRKIGVKKAAIVEEEKKKKEKGELLDPAKMEYLTYVAGQLKILDKAIECIDQNMAVFRSKEPLITREDVADFLNEQYKKDASSNAVYVFPLGNHHPLFSQLVLDFANETITIRLHQDVQALRSLDAKSEVAHIQLEALNRWIAAEVARIAQKTGESITAELSDFRVNLSHLSDSKSFIALDLSALASKFAKQTLGRIVREWKPVHDDLVAEKLPRLDGSAFKEADASQKKLCLVVLAPSVDESLISGLRPSSIYVVLRGFQSLFAQYQKFPDSEEAKLFTKEFSNLSELLQKRGFIGYSGATPGVPADLARDYVFELDDYYSMLLKATREDFYVQGNKKFALLEFTDVEQRILTQNRIDDAIQDELLQWKEAYQAAQVDLNPMVRLSVPEPTRNTYWANFKLSWKKYFRGDDSRILRWGLDLSGGKSVRLALMDQAGHVVTQPEELKQAVNELYTRINKMGVSERTIRIENSTILLDFPGSQGLSAQELVKASSMYFHVMNEQFGAMNKPYAKEVNEFLQEVWNEGVITNREDTESLNQIACQKMEMASRHETTFGPKTAAQFLYEKGLRLANPHEGRPTAAFDDSLSMIGRFRSDEARDWSFPTHPLTICYRNFALDGASLEGVQTGYDPSEGNILLFSVKSKSTREGAGNPQDDFYAWTSQFSKEGIVGTPREAYTQGRGFRMAVILNGTIISAPALSSPLRDHAKISGHFSQSEIQKLATDLKAGSLSFTPRILSEQNVSPELGEHERQKGITAALIGVALVIAAMVSYYRFAGLVASIAVLVNVLIIWAVMQNLDAALTLPGIAGMVLTVGMAVDANVLVFERIREEFKISGRIASAIHAGYRKAFSAIFDSNITTILAAFILLQFDSGPIKGFATTLIIGISSSMFTALFMTRYFFAGWVRNPAHRELKMAEWIKPSGFDFLKMAKPAFVMSAILFVIGAAVFVTNFKEMVGMDFTGGYSLVVEVDNKSDKDLSAKVAQALSKKGLRAQEFQIRELGRPNLLRIQLGVSLEEPGHPFYKLPQELSGGQYGYEYQKNPRINWVVQALDSAGLKIKESQLPTLSNNWTVMSGQFSDTMRDNAIWALSLSLIGILLYIAFRFEWKYSVSAVLALLHDVLLTLAVMAIAHRLGAPVQLNLEVIGAIMTIIGYSLNDTIIVFDRVREDIRLMHKKSFGEILNYALNQTLSRTLMTSGTTLLVLLALDFFAGSSIFGFAFVMTVGVFLGTLSSLFIAAPILLWLHEREEAKKLQLARA